MKWEITKKLEPQVGDVRFVTKFSFLPTQVLSKITMTDHIIWLELFIEEQQYIEQYGGWDGSFKCWETIAKTIHI